MFQVGPQRVCCVTFLHHRSIPLLYKHGEIGWLAIYVVGIGRSACLPASRCSVHLT
jgi:hypothetical protein